VTAPRILLAAAVAVVALGAAEAQTCRRAGSTVSCDDGRVGIFAGDAIV
jgi:hypothetical protein